MKSHHPYRPGIFVGLAVLCITTLPCTAARADHLRELQSQAKASGRAEWGYWGGSPDQYSGWKTHSNRLIPVYAYGMTLESVAGPHSVYRDEKRIRELFGRLPDGALNPEADYFDQCDIFRLQEAAFAAGKKHVILIVFDGLDWQTAWAAATYKSGRFGYREGPGTGLYFQDYRDQQKTTFGFGSIVTSPHNQGTGCDVNAQTVTDPGGLTLGGYDAALGGQSPWSAGNAVYLMGLGPERFHAVTDSASSATSMAAGIKTYNDAINVDARGRQVAPLGQIVQRRGLGVGVVTSVPISHATPACAYANNVHRDDYQDITRDLLGLPSVAHRQPLPGVDVLIGAGWGESKDKDAPQGSNFVPGNRYLTADDLAAADVTQGGKYLVSQRTAGQPGSKSLVDSARQAAEKGQRLFGYYGVASAHLPFQTADGQYDPAPGVKGTEQYSPEDIAENPTLADMARAALIVLEKNPRGFWLMLEAGDVDWANHDNNIDNSIGAVLSGDDAFRAVVEWIESRHGWDDTVVLLTADHGHMLNLVRPEALLP